MNLSALLAFESHPYETALHTEAINSMVANSLRQLVNGFFMEMAPSFMVLVSCRYEGVLHFFRDILMRLQNISGLNIQSVRVDYTRPERIAGPRLHNLVLVDSFQGFLDIDLASYVGLYDTNEYTYVFLQQRDHMVIKDMQRVFDYCWRHQMINCNVQTQSARGEIKMYTYFPYTAQHCNRVVPVLINEFHAISGWLHADYFPNKLRNLHQCPLIVAVRDLPPFVELLPTRNSSDARPRLDGFEGGLMNEIADHLNFTLKIKLLEVDDRTKNYCCGVMSNLEGFKVHMAVGYYRKRAFMVNLSTNVFPHYQGQLVASLNLNAHNLTAYEILVHPFDLATWLCVLICLLLAYCCAELIHYQSAQRRRILDCLPLIGTLLGIALSREPRTLPNRWLYAATLWTTFLVRCIYAAFLYSIFRDSIHRQLPDSVVDLLRLDYFAVANRYAYNDMQDLPHFHNYDNMRSDIISTENELVAFPILSAEETDRYFAISAKEYLIYYGTKNRMPGKFHIVRQNIMAQQLTIYLTKHSFLVNQMDVTIMQFQANGLLQFWHQRKLDDRYFHSRHLYGQKFINQRDLMAIYMVVVLLQSIALLVFMLELLSKRMSKLRKLFQ